MIEKIEDYTLGKKRASNSDTINKFGIIGGGAMGQEIAIIVSSAGLDVVFVDLTMERVKIITSKIEKQLDDIINRWGMTNSEKRSILSRIKGSDDFNILHDCDLVIETIYTEKLSSSLKIRKEAFEKAESFVSKDTILASNVSTLLVTDIASDIKKPDRVIGIHFIQPASQNRIIEVVKSIHTSNKTYEKTLKFARMVDLKVIGCNESPGNISTRLIVTLINEACEILMEGVSTIENIDTVMKIGYGLQFGPFEIADRIGIDKILRWMEVLYSEYGDRKFKASPVLKRLVRMKHFGRSNRKGFYNYENDQIAGENTDFFRLNYING